MPNDVATPNDVTTIGWTELPVALGAEPAVCVGLIALANDGTIEADVHDYLRAADIRICTTRVRTPLRNTLASLVDLGDTIFYLQPSSVTRGVEFEGNFVLTPGVSLYLNGTAANAYYEGKLNAGTQTAPYYERAPSGLWVARRWCESSSLILSAMRAPPWILSS